MQNHEICTIRNFEFRLGNIAKLSKGEALLLLNTLEVYENTANCVEKRNAALGAFFKYLEGRGIVAEKPGAVEQLKPLKVNIIGRLY